MHCSGCGQGLMAGQAYCTRCGRASGMAFVPGVGPWGWPPLAWIERRVNALAVGWFVYSGLSALVGLMGLAFWNAAVWNASNGGRGEGLGALCCRIVRPGIGFPWMSHAWFGNVWVGFAGAALLLHVVLGFAAGVGLMQKTHWGRWVAIVAGLLAILHFPLGTAMGIWTLVVLLKAPNAAGYEAMAR